MHHPHVLQGFERYRDGLIAYSLGDFLFDKAEYATLPSAVLCVELKSGGRWEIASANAVPLFIEGYIPRVPDAQTRARLLSHLDLLSAPYATRVYDDGECGHIVQASGTARLLSAPTSTTEMAAVRPVGDGTFRTEALRCPTDIRVLRRVAVSCPRPSGARHGEWVIELRAGRNRLLFSDFESAEPTLWDTQHGWKTFDKARSHSGYQALRLERRVGDARRAIGAQRTPDYTDLPRDRVVSRQGSRAHLGDGQEYLARGFLSGDSLGRAGLEVRWYERPYVNELHPVLRVNRVASPVSASSTWTLCQQWLSRPEGAKFATVWCTFGGVPLAQHWQAAALTAGLWLALCLLVRSQIYRHYEQLARVWPGRRTLRLRGPPSRRTMFLQAAAILACACLGVFFASAKSYVWFDDVELIEWSPWQPLNDEPTVSHEAAIRFVATLSPSDPHSRADYIQLRVRPMGQRAAGALTARTAPDRLSITWTGEAWGPAR
jgi:hypothetical protein